MWACRVLVGAQEVAVRQNEGTCWVVTCGGAVVLWFLVVSPQSGRVGVSCVLCVRVRVCVSAYFFSHKSGDLFLLEGERRGTRALFLVALFMYTKRKIIVYD